MKDLHWLQRQKMTISSRGQVATLRTSADTFGLRGFGLFENTEDAQ